MLKKTYSSGDKMIHLGYPGYGEKISICRDIIGLSNII